MPLINVHAYVSSRATDVYILIILESPSQFESRIMALVYVRSNTRSKLCTEKLHFVSQNWRMEN